VNGGASLAADDARLFPGRRGCESGAKATELVCCIEYCTRQRHDARAGFFVRGGSNARARRLRIPSARGACFFGNTLRYLEDIL